jgi:hypothetical protein
MMMILLLIFPKKFQFPAHTAQSITAMDATDNDPETWDASGSVTAPSGSAVTASGSASGSAVTADADASGSAVTADADASGSAVTADASGSAASARPGTLDFSYC